MDKRLYLPAFLLALALLACGPFSLSGGGGASQGGDTPDPVPVSINEGLASLNSYDMTVRFSSVSPDPLDSTSTEIRRQHTSDPDASYTQISVSSSAGGDGPVVTESHIYQIGNDQCVGSDAEGWTWSSSTSVQAEMAGLVTSMIGLTPLIDDPVFVAAETLNGIPTDHFSFKVSGLGVSSGAVVNTNAGNYWLAVDGKYIVKYSLVIDMSTAADAPSHHTEVSIEMTQVNGPVSIAFPAGCLAAAAIAP
jgi:hypothetical protein